MIPLIVLCEADEIANELTELKCFCLELALKCSSAELCGLVLKTQFGVGLCKIEVGQCVTTL